MSTVEFSRSLAPTVIVTMTRREKIRADWCAIVDRFYYRNVPDVHGTHFVLALQAVARALEAEIAEWADTSVATIDIEAAPLRLVVAAELPSVMAGRSTAELPALSATEKLGWADGNRAAKAQGSARASAAGAQVTATKRLAELAEERIAVLHRAKDLCEQAREAFRLRTARYTRGRVGLFGMRPTSEPRIHEYVPASPPRYSDHTDHDDRKANR